MMTPQSPTTAVMEPRSITPENFSDLYKEHYPLLLKYTYVIVRHKQMAQDIVSDLFCDLWNNRDKLTIHTNLRNYLLVSARRMATKQLNRSTAVSRWEISTAGLASGELETALLAMEGSDTVEQDPQTALIQKEKHMLLGKLLAQLSPQRQEIIQLRMLGLSYLEIATALQITTKKVEYHLTTAIYSLNTEVKRKPHLKELSFLLLLPQLMTMPQFVCEVTIW